MNATPQALDELKKVLISEDCPTAGFRIFTQQGCCQPTLQMSVVEIPAIGDLQLKIDAINFFMDDQARDMLTGVTIDFGPNGFKLEGLIKSGRCCS
jgi:Fe-S cluster assembly iron-binding protein IscA